MIWSDREKKLIDLADILSREHFGHNIRENRKLYTKLMILLLRSS